MALLPHRPAAAPYSFYPIRAADVRDIRKWFVRRLFRIIRARPRPPTTDDRPPPGMSVPRWSVVGGRWSRPHRQLDGPGDAEMREERNRFRRRGNCLCPGDGDARSERTSSAGKGGED